MKDETSNKCFELEAKQLLSVWILSFFKLEHITFIGKFTFLYLLEACKLIYI